MSDTYTWSVSNLDRELSNGSVNNVHWTLSATRPNPNVSGESYSASLYGSQGFTADPSASGFIPYDQLTEAVCIGWVQDSFGSEAVTAMESGLSDNLDEQENPTEGTGTPWTTFDS